MQTAVQFRYERLAPLLSEDVLPTLGGGQAALAAAEVLTAFAGQCSNIVLHSLPLGPVHRWVQPG